MISVAWAEVRVGDGDSLTLQGRQIRLQGVDAVELHQKCQDSNGQQWDCGEKAKQALKRFVKGKEIKCETQAIDKYKRKISICYADGQDIGAHMVEIGYATAYRKYSPRYIHHEKRARDAKKGIWQGEFTPPSVWRRLNPRK